MSESPAGERDRKPGLDWLPSDFTEADLDAVPVLGSLDKLLIAGLTDEEYDRFLAALSE